METKKKPRAYRKVTPAVIARTKAEAAIRGNDTAAVRVLEPELEPSQRARRIRQKASLANAVAVIDEELSRIGLVAIDKLAELVEHTDAKIAQKSVHYAIDQVRGKALQRSDVRVAKVNIQSALDE